MLDFYLNGQSMKMFSPVIAADSLNYLTAKFHFTGSDWNGYTKTAHFRKQDASPAIVYDIQLDSDNSIAESSHLNLTAGLWEVYLTGTKDTSRLTGIVNIINVKESGLIDAPLHELPQSLAEQIDGKAANALLTAQAVKDAADRGDFNGKDGKGFSIMGYFTSLAALEAAVTEPKADEMYGIGSGAPYDIYAYDFVNSVWVNNGAIQGPTGATGATGISYVPFVDDNGNISWSNSSGAVNPETKNIKGPAGATGAAGAAGKSAYATAVDGGYTGTEATFNSAMSVFPYHNARHAAGGADPITVKTGNVENGAVTTVKLADSAVTSAKIADSNITTAKIANSNVTAAKIAANAVSTVYTGTLSSSGWTTWNTNGGYQEITVSGLLTTDNIIVDLNVSTPATASSYSDAAEQYNYISAMQISEANKLRVWCLNAKPTVNIPIKILAVRK